MTWEPLPEQHPGPRQLTSALTRLHSTMGLARPDTVRLLERHWTSLLGAELAPKCRLDAVRGTELVVSVTDPALAEHLRWSAADLCSAVNAVCDGDVIDQVTVRVRRAVS